MTDIDAPRPAPSQALVLTMTAVCSCALATLYYSQPLLPEMGASFGVDASHAGLLTTISQIGYTLGLLLFVPLGDRLERRRLIGILLGCNMLSLALCAASPRFAWLQAGSFLLGFTAISAQIIIPGIASLAPPERRGRVLGVLLSGMTAGQLFARTLSGGIGEALGWRGMFVLAILFDVVLITVVWRMMPAIARTTDLPYPKLLASLWHLLRQERVLRVACLSGLLYFASFSTIWATLAALLARAPYHFTAGTVGLFGLLGIGGMLALPLIGRLSERVGINVMLVIGPALGLSAFTMISFTDEHLWLLIVGIVVLDVGVRFGLIANQTRIYAIAPEARSRINTLFMVHYFMGGAVGSSIATLAIRHHGWLGLSLTGGALALLALAAHLLSLPGDRRPAAQTISP